MTTIKPFLIAGLLALAFAVPAAATASEAPIAAPPPLLTQSYSLFRTPPEPLPAKIREALAPGIEDELPPIAGHGINLDLAQRAVPLGKGHRALWVIPGRDWLLFYEEPKGSSFGGSEGPIAQAVRGSMAFWVGVPGTKDPHLVSVKALIPDGVQSVEIAKGVRARTHDNVISRQVDQAKLWEHWKLIRGEPLIRGVSVG